jgi:hypothetical protein
MASIFRCAYNSDHTTGVRMVNVFHVVTHNTSLLTGDTPASAVRDALHAALTTKYRAILPTTLTVQSLVVREELAPGSTAVPEESSQTIGLAGTLSTSGDMLPVPTCILSTFYSTAAVRSGHGRMFLPGCGPAANLNSGGQWDTATALWTAVAAFLDELKATHSGGGFFTGFDAHQVIYSRTRRAAGAAQYWFDVQSYTRRQAPHWLRSRLTAP